MRTTTLAEALITNIRKPISRRSGSLPEPRTHRAPDVCARLPADRCRMAMQAGMRPVLIASILAVLFGCSPAVAQMGDTVSGIGATSPPGMTAGTSVPPTGDPMGATELPSAGLSPIPTGSIGITGNSVACPALASSSPGMSGTATTYDGGGMTMGMPLPGSMPPSGTCGTSSTAAASSSAMSIASPGAISPAGIPLGSVETSNAGLSPVPVSPMPSPMPLVAGSSAYPSMITAPDSSSPMLSGPSTFTPAVGIGGPCTTIGASVSSASSTGC